MSAIRQSIAGIILIIYFKIYKNYFPTKRELVFHFFMGLMIFTFANGLTTWAIKYIPSGLGALLGCVFPLLLYITNAIYYKTKIHFGSLLGLLIGFAGVAIIFYSYLGSLFQKQFLFGIILCLLGVLSWTIGSFFSSRKVLKGNNLQGIGWQMLFGGLQLFVFSFLMNENHQLNSIYFQGWACLVYLILIGSLLCFMCYMFVLKNLPASISGIYAYFNPIVALLLGIILLNEPLTGSLILGSLVTLIGVYIVKHFTTK